MAKVMWLGEDTEDTPGPSFNIWNGVKFRKDQWVDLTDAHMLGKARNSRFYKVLDGEPDVAERPVIIPHKYVSKEELQEQYGHDTSGARDVTAKEETQHAQGKALERKAQELKSKIETKKEAHDFRKTEKGSGYTPLKKRLKKEKAARRAGVSAPHARPDSTDTDAA